MMSSKSSQQQRLHSVGQTSQSSEQQVRPAMRISPPAKKLSTILETHSSTVKASQGSAVTQKGQPLGGKYIAAATLGNENESTPLPQRTIRPMRRIPAAMKLLPSYILSTKRPHTQTDEESAASSIVPRGMREQFGARETKPLCSEKENSPAPKQTHRPMKRIRAAMELLPSFILKSAEAKENNAVQEQNNNSATIRDKTRPQKRCSSMMINPSQEKKRRFVV